MCGSHVCWKWNVFGEGIGLEMAERGQGVKNMANKEFNNTECEALGQSIIYHGRQSLVGYLIVGNYVESEFEQGTACSMICKSE